MQVYHQYGEGSFRLCKLQKECNRLAAASDKVYQLLAHSRWFSPGTPASSTTKTGRHEIAEILLKVALNINRSNQYDVPFVKSALNFTELAQKLLLVNWSSKRFLKNYYY